MREFYSYEEFATVYFKLLTPRGDWFYVASNDSDVTKTIELPTDKNLIDLNKGVLHSPQEDVVKVTLNAGEIHIFQPI